MTQALDSWQWHEDRTQRTQPSVHSWGKTFKRVYSVPSETADSLPVRGELMIDEDAATGLQTPRVMTWSLKQQPVQGLVAVVSWGQVVPFTDGTGAVSTGDDLLELRGSRPTRFDGRYKYASRIYAATSDTQADNIPTMFTDTAGTADSGKLGRRKQSTTSNDEVIPGIWLITAQYIGFVEEELMFMRSYDANALTGPRGTQVFVELSTAATGRAIGLLKTYFPGVSPKMPCFSARPEWNPLGLDGIAFIRATYGLSVSRYQRRVGQMRITAKVMSRAKVKRMYSLSDPTQLTEGWDGNDYWQVVKGTNKVDDTSILLKIETAVPAGSPLIASSMELKGHTNSDTFNLAIYGFVPKETFLFVGSELTETFDATITPINYYIEVEPKGWNHIDHSQKGRFEVRQHKVLTSAGADSGDKKTVMSFVPNTTDLNGNIVKTKSVLLQNHPYAVFSNHLSGLTQWKL